MKVFEACSVNEFKELNFVYFCYNKTQLSTEVIIWCCPFMEGTAVLGNCIFVDVLQQNFNAVYQSVTLNSLFTKRLNGWYKWHLNNRVLNLAFLRVFHCNQLNKSFCNFNQLYSFFCQTILRTS